VQGGGGRTVWCLGGFGDDRVVNGVYDRLAKPQCTICNNDLFQMSCNLSQEALEGFIRKGCHCHWNTCSPKPKAQSVWSEGGCQPLAAATPGVHQQMHSADACCSLSPLPP
jgi:hypothetical protein